MLIVLPIVVSWHILYQISLPSWSLHPYHSNCSDTCTLCVPIFFAHLLIHPILIVLLHSHISVLFMPGNLPCRPHTRWNAPCLAFIFRTSGLWSLRIVLFCWPWFWNEWQELFNACKRQWYIQLFRKPSNQRRAACNARQRSSTESYVAWLLSNNVSSISVAVYHSVPQMIVSVPGC